MGVVAGRFGLYVLVWVLGFGSCGLGLVGLIVGLVVCEFVIVITGFLRVETALIQFFPASLWGSWWC